MSVIGVLQVFIIVLSAAKAQFVFPNRNVSGEKWLLEQARSAAQKQSKEDQDYKLMLYVSTYLKIIKVFKQSTMITFSLVSGSMCCTWLCYSRDGSLHFDLLPLV